MKKNIQTEVINKKYYIPEKKGNGIVSVYLIRDKSGNVLEYSLAYINTKIFAKDNGRIIGYDSENGNHHCHRMGKYEKVCFESYDKTLELFEKDWKKYHEELG